MLHLIKRTGLFLALMLVGAQSIFGYALLGPSEYFMAQSIGYNLSGNMLGLGDDGGSADVGYPKNFNQGYRWNTPTNYYVIDFTFERFFGAIGESNIDAAFQMYNNLGQLSSININQYPYHNPTSRNYRAAALELVDVKSTMVSLLIEQLGLAQPDRWTYCLADRYTGNGLKCPTYEYEVIQRNFDPFTGVYSSYVNDVFYDFYIEELCLLNPNPWAPLTADAIEIVVDPAYQLDALSSVAAMSAENNYGAFYLTFTRDDIGGLKNLYSPSNVFPEMAETNSVMISTNTRNQELLVTSNLMTFEEEALTNNDAALLALYPGLVITSESNFFGLAITTNYFAYLTNSPFASAGTFELVLGTNYTTNVQTLYYRTYANLEILHSNATSIIALQTVTNGPVPFGTPGTTQFFTNTTYTAVNVPSGDFYILPTNLCGPYQIISNVFVNVVATTNVIPVFTNILTLTTNGVTNFVSSVVITYFTQHYYAVYEVDCVTNTEATREGMDGFHFVRVPDTNYDSTRRLFYTPITNIYHLTALSNGVPIIQTFQRVLYAPDIIIAGGVFPNMIAGPAGVVVDGAVDRPTPQFNQTLVPPGNGGPGTIEPTGLVFTFNTIGPVFFNATSGFFLNGLSGVYAFASTNTVLGYNWGSFDGTTNTPVVYPDPDSISQYEAQLFYQIVTPAALPDASVKANSASNPYSYKLSASANMNSPTWGLTTNSAGMPPGLSLSTGGTISGSPGTTGTYDFTVQAKDSSGNVAQKVMTLQVNP